jgi:predicted dehydrogenase
MEKSLRAGIIGHTGRGDYGHHLDVSYQWVPEVKVVAVADPDPEGLEATGVKTEAGRLYADYREMLEAEDLDLVNVCPRRPVLHSEMVIAAAASGARGILLEKPFARTLSEADAMLDACHRNGVRMAVAHRRANAYEQHGKKLVEEGAIGGIQSIRSHGKADRRSGALDLMVLGTHMMDSMRHFAGSDVAWANGQVTQDGREVTVHDIREGDEEIGLIAGNAVTAYYAFENGISAYFESYPSDPAVDRSKRWFGFEVYGETGIISLRDSPSGEMYIYPHGRWIPGEDDGKGERIVLEDWEKAPDGHVRSYEERMHLSNRIVAGELVRAGREDRDVAEVSSGEDARAALEMIMAVHESQRLGARVSFPLKNRENPYRTWLDAKE